MNILAILIPLALGLGACGLAAFLWSLRSGQFDDLEGAGWRVIADDDLGDEPAAEGRQRAFPPPAPRSRQR